MAFLLIFGPVKNRQVDHLAIQGQGKAEKFFLLEKIFRNLVKAHLNNKRVCQIRANYKIFLGGNFYEWRTTFFGEDLENYRGPVFWSEILPIID